MAVLYSMMRSAWHMVPKPWRRAWRRWRGRYAAARWQRLQAKSGFTVVKLANGLRIRLYGDSELCRGVFQGAFEKTEQWFTSAFLRPGDVYVDVGANIGLFTLLAARTVGASGHVYSFEPTPKTFGRLEDNVRLNGLSNVSCHQLALSDQTGQAKLVVAREGYDAWNSLGAPSVGHGHAELVVKTETWTHFAQEHGLVGKVTLMKVDVEGWEEHVLSGAREVLTRKDAPCLYIEFSDGAAKASGALCRDLYRALEALGFGLFKVDRKSHILEADPIRDTYPYVNLVATKDPEQVNSRLASR